VLLQLSIAFGMCGGNPLPSPSCDIIADSLALTELDTIGFLPLKGYTRDTLGIHQGYTRDTPGNTRDVPESIDIPKTDP
jgi:hypothetical protein